MTPTCSQLTTLVERVRSDKRAPTQREHETFDRLVRTYMDEGGAKRSFISLLRAQFVFFVPVESEEEEESSRCVQQVHDAVREAHRASAPPGSNLRLGKIMTAPEGTSNAEITAAAPPGATKCCIVKDGKQETIGDLSDDQMRKEIAKAAVSLSISPPDARPVTPTNDVMEREAVPFEVTKQLIGAIRRADQANDFRALFDYMSHETALHGGCTESANNLSISREKLLRQVFRVTLPIEKTAFLDEDIPDTIPPVTWRRVLGDGELTMGDLAIAANATRVLEVFMLAFHTFQLDWHKPYGGLIHTIMVTRRYFMLRICNPELQKDNVMSPEWRNDLKYTGKMLQRTIDYIVFSAGGRDSYTTSAKLDGAMSIAAGLDWTPLKEALVALCQHTPSKASPVRSAIFTILIGNCVHHLLLPLAARVELSEVASVSLLSWILLGSLEWVDDNGEHKRCPVWDAVCETLDPDDDPYLLLVDTLFAAVDRKKFMVARSLLLPLREELTVAFWDRLIKAMATKDTGAHKIGNKLDVIAGVTPYHNESYTCTPLEEFAKWFYDWRVVAKNETQKYRNRIDEAAWKKGLDVVRQEEEAAKRRAAEAEAARKEAARKKQTYALERKQRAAAELEAQRLEKERAASAAQARLQEEWKGFLGAVAKYADTNWAAYEAATDPKAKEKAKQKLFHTMEKFARLDSEAQADLRRHCPTELADAEAVVKGQRELIKTTKDAGKPKPNPNPEAAAVVLPTLPTPEPEAKASARKKGKKKAKAAETSLSEPSPTEPSTSRTLADVQGLAKAPPESTLGGQTTCVVCFVNDKSSAAVPCGHVCVCVSCSEQLKNCPMCRTGVNWWLNVYMT